MRALTPATLISSWAADAPSAAKIFVQDASFDAFVGWSPDIYKVTDKLKGTRLVVTTGTANHLIADVWAVRNDFYHDHPDIVASLVKGIFEGVDMVRKDPPKMAARALAAAFKLPEEDCGKMIGGDGGDRRGRRAPDQLPEERQVLPGSVQPGELRGGVEQCLHHLQVTGDDLARRCPPTKVKRRTSWLPLCPRLIRM